MTIGKGDTVRFYVSWYHGDPLYQCYDDECCMLVSPTSVASDWTLRRLPALPRKVMIDSGGFRYMTVYNKMPTPREVFEQQLRMLKDTDVPATLCALDFPMAERNLSSNEWDRRLTQTLSFAYDFRRLIDLYRLDRDIEFMAIVQGYDVPSLVACARELKTMGFTSYGVGSLVGLYAFQEILDRVKAVISVVGEGVHVFGLSSTRTLRALARIGATSVDSSRPVKSAAYNEILYSKPFRRYGILGKDGEPTGIIPRMRCLSEPLNCDCPICRENASDILQVGDRRYIARRAIHNYYHFKASIQ
jgi:queuine/archaeosine tRNA-ribosyltransferase